MQDSEKNYRITLREVLSYLRRTLAFYCIFIKLWFSDSIFIIKNINRDVNKYNLHPLSIVYNTMIKYPLKGFRPAEFFMYKLFKNSYKEYLTFFLGYMKIVSANKIRPYLLDNKLSFKSHIQSNCNGIKTSKLLAYYDHDTKKITHYAEPSSKKVVLKPLIGHGGYGFKKISADKIKEELKKCITSYIAEDFIEQHNLLNLIFSESVNTIRVLTLKKDDNYYVIKAILRVGRTSTKGVDNISSGGISINIDMKTGTLGKGRRDYRYGDAEYEIHPDSKYKFYGEKIPYFKELKKISIDSHKCFPMYKLIGWDISITPSGPILIEGNRVPDLDLYQIHEPLGEQLSSM